MGRVLITDSEGARRGVLTESTLVGRHWRCDLVLPDPRVPLYWLEIRWMGASWEWRCLGAEDRTVGKGRASACGWRFLRLSQDLKLETVMSVIRLTDSSSPGIVIEDLETRERLDDERRFRFIRLEESGAVIDLGSEEGADLPAGTIIQAENRLLRLHRPSDWAPTREPMLSILAPDLSINPLWKERIAHFFTPNCAVELRGEVVRVLAVYAEARAVDAWNDDGGWRSNEEVHAAWLTLGGNPESGSERMNWERNRLKSMLVELGVVGTKSLFERRRRATQWKHRLSLHPRQLLLETGP